MRQTLYSSDNNREDYGIKDLIDADNKSVKEDENHIPEEEERKVNIMIF